MVQLVRRWNCLQRQLFGLSRKYQSGCKLEKYDWPQQSERDEYNKGSDGEEYYLSELLSPLLEILLNNA